MTVNTVEQIDSEVNGAWVADWCALPGPTEASSVPREDQVLWSSGLCLIGFSQFSTALRIQRGEYVYLTSHKADTKGYWEQRVQQYKVLPQAERYNAVKKKSSVPCAIIQLMGGLLEGKTCNKLTNHSCCGPLLQHIVIYPGVFHIRPQYTFLRFDVRV